MTGSWVAKNQCTVYLCSHHIWDEMCLKRCENTMVNQEHPKDLGEQILFELCPRLT